MIMTLCTCRRLLITSPPEGVARYCFHPANILIFYFSATGRDIDLKLIQDTYGIVLDSLKIIDLLMSKVKTTGTVHYLLKVQLYHKN